jgi:hypothetical protein
MLGEGRGRVAQFSKRGSQHEATKAEGVGGGNDSPTHPIRFWVYVYRSAALLRLPVASRLPSWGRDTSRMKGKGNIYICVCV